MNRNRKFIRTTNHKDDRQHRSTKLKAALRGVDADSAEDLDLVTRGEGMTQNRQSWDKRRSYATNATKRWLRTQAKRGLTWGEVRPQLVEMLKDKGEVDYLVDQTREIDGVIHVVHPYLGPTPLADYYMRDCVVVMPDGKLHHHVAAKRRGAPPKKFFHFERDEFWFKLANGSIFHAPISALRRPLPVTTAAPRARRIVIWHAAAPAKFPGFIRMGYNKSTPYQFHQMELDMCHAKQTTVKKAPEEVAGLSPIENSTIETV